MRRQEFGPTGRRDAVEDRLSGEDICIEAVQMSISELDADVTKTGASRKDLVVTLSTRSSLGLKFPALWSAVLQDPDEARKVAPVAFDGDDQVVPQERMHERTVGETVPHMMEETLDAVMYTLQDGVQYGTVEQINRGLFPLIRKEIWEVTQHVPNSKCTIEQFIDVPVPQITVEAVKHVQHQRVQSKAVEQIVAVAVPRTQEETGRVIQLTPQDRTPDRVVE